MPVLDSSQHAAATADHAVQLILAGPGSGKTSALVGRFKHLVDTGVDPRRILAVTFTKKATDEMRMRITQAIGPDTAQDLRVFTFHALALRCLQRNPHYADLPERFDVWSMAQQRAVFAMRRMFWNEDQDILDVIGAAKEQLLDAAAFEASLKPDDTIGKAAVPFFRIYEEALREAGAIDFADMVPLLLKAVDAHPAYGRSIAGTVDHLLVDEYQDINPGQDRLIGHFVRGGVHLWAVGDDDQTLFTFRAADVRYILGFKGRHRGAKVHVLDRNYRSMPPIVHAAKRLIGHNKNRLDKDYSPALTEPGDIVVRGYSTPDVEVEQVTKAIAMLIAGGMAPQQIAVLYRVGSVGLGFQTSLEALKIPFEVRGAGDLWQGATAKLFLGALFYLLDADDRRALDKMGTGKRSELTRRKLDGVSARARRDFRLACREVHDIVSDAIPKKAAERERREWTGVSDAIGRLAASCSSLEDFIQKVADQSRALKAPSERAVILSTVHSAKGLEWEAVFVVALEEGMMPSLGSEIEEERRIAYVAVTRAKRLLGLTYVAERGGTPSRRSRFITEFTANTAVETLPEDRTADQQVPLLSDQERAAAAAGSVTTKKRAVVRKTPAERSAVPTDGGWSPRDDLKLQSSFATAVSLDDICSAVQKPSEAVLGRLVALKLVRSKTAALARWAAA
ncbi:ATP-dependent helicase [Lichenihabitans sp. PAMC28606]|uniref:ATP-dependent helicase n=1 Tax=Lichenihabitans sp. PAMC28606 TaxID=2880932 RepID=UPI001D0AD252|nr:ATP-dependent helicase [Lichenihabitans sp. PAMC28606]UDL96015.1 ATP-dependent helicase [Lichenihabitans sp. PAMC28606]